MDSFQLKGLKDPASANAADTVGYIREAKERLRQLAPEPASGTPSVDDIEVQLEQYFGQRERLDPGPVPSTPERVAESVQPQATQVPGVRMDDLRAKVMDRVIDRVLQDWERSGPPDASLGDQIMERLIDRLFEQFKASH